MATIKFPPKTLRLMAKLGLSEAAVSDAFHNGKPSGRNGMVKKYSGYETGLFYARDEKTGDFVITYVWKRERR